MLYGTANTDDLLVFLRIAAFLESGESLSSAAKRMGVSPSVLSTLMDRVESAFPRQQLIIRRTGAGGGTFLTELGRQALKSTLTGFDELRQKQSRFDVACSQTLLDVVGPALSEAIPNDGRADVHVRLGFAFEICFTVSVRGIRMWHSCTVSASVSRSTRESRQHSCPRNSILYS
jgi:DNA-binding transcriptional LysR family regulator